MRSLSASPKREQPVNLLSFPGMLPGRHFLRSIPKFIAVFAVFLLPATFLDAQQAATAPPAAASGKNNPEFLATADDVLHEMSEITGWELKSPLKKTMRSREEIHAYVIKQMEDEKDARER